MMRIINKILIFSIFNTSFIFANSSDSIAKLKEKKIVLEFQLQQIEAQESQANSLLKKHSSKLKNATIELEKIKTESSSDFTDQVQLELDNRRNSLEKFLSEELRPLKERCQDIQSEICTTQLAETEKKQEMLVEKINNQEALLTSTLQRSKNGDKLLIEAQNNIDQASKLVQDYQGQVEFFSLSQKNIEKEIHDLELSIQKESTLLNSKKNNSPAFINHKHLTFSEENKKQAILAGKSDGLLLARSLGVYKGSQLGDLDGKSIGLKISGEKSYKRGFTQGLIDGKVIAENSGKEKAYKKGKKLGIEAAAKKDALADARFNAEQSNAKRAGDKQAKLEAKINAQTKGQLTGVAKGEAQAIDKFQNRSLVPINIEGPYIGTFSSKTPSYPGFNCLDRTQKASLICPSLDRAFSNSPAYIQHYNQARQAAFLENIDRVYLEVFDNAKNAAISYFDNNEIPTELEKGLAQGKKQSMADFEVLIEANYTNKIVEKYQLSPDKKSATYKRNYNKHYQKEFNKLWTEIKNLSYKETYKNIFPEELAKAVEAARAKRYKEVNHIFESNPILQVTKTQFVDGGIKGLGANDGINQPGEKLIHHLTIKNFGLVDAHGITFETVDGQSFNVPSIPASTELTIKGVAYTRIPSDLKVGQKFRPVAIIKAPRSADEKVLSLHYFDRDEDILAKEAKTSVSLKYPISVSNIQISRPLLYNQKSFITATITNHSKEVLNGNINIVLKSKTQTNAPVVAEQFPIIKQLDGPTSISGAAIEVLDIKDTYLNLDFDIEVIYDGYILGKNSQPIKLVAKTKYDQTNNKNIIYNGTKTEDEDINNALKALDKKKQPITVFQSRKSTQKVNQEIPLIKNSTLIVLEQLQQSKIAKIIKTSVPKAIIKLSTSFNEIKNNIRINNALSKYEIETNNLDKDLIKLSISFHTSKLIPVVKGNKDNIEHINTLKEYLIQDPATLSSNLKDKKEIDQNFYKMLLLKTLADLTKNETPHFTNELVGHFMKEKNQKHLFTILYALSLIIKDNNTELDETLRQQLYSKVMKIINSNELLENFNKNEPQLVEYIQNNFNAYSPFSVSE